MKFCAAALLLVPSDAFLAPFTTPKQSTIARKGYLDDLSQYIAKEEREEDDSDHSVFKATDAEKDRFGVGDWSKFVDFDEFDGGDGQMGVAGDGQKGLEKEWEGAAQMAKSRTMSAKNAWGKSTGYAEQLRAQGMDTARAQQLENWQNQQEVLRERKQARWMTEEFDKVTSDEDWRSLAKFGVERNQDFDLDQTLGPVVPGEVLGYAELSSRLNQPKIHEFSLRNNFMGFSDFRARIVPNNGEWQIEPEEGSLSGKSDTDFTVRFRPNNPGVTECYLVIDTEDDKWTYKLIGNASM